MLHTLYDYMYGFFYSLLPLCLQIAVRYLLPELEGRKLTVKLHREVAEAFVQRFGSYAGWAHTVLFIAELSSQQSLLPLHLRVPKKQSVKASR
jgi:hypothetical protein